MKEATISDKKWRKKQGQHGKQTLPQGMGGPPVEDDAGFDTSHSSSSRPQLFVS